MWRNLSEEKAKMQSLSQAQNFRGLNYKAKISGVDHVYFDIGGNFEEG